MCNIVMRVILILFKQTKFLMNGLLMTVVRTSSSNDGNFVDRPNAFGRENILLLILLLRGSALRLFKDDTLII